MMLRVENDRRHSIGHARIVIQGMPMPNDGGFHLVREGYAAANLGRRGWQVQEVTLKPVAMYQEGQDTILVLGPVLTRFLEPGPLIFTLPAARLETSLFWPDDIDVFDGDLPPETELPNEAEMAPAPPPVAAASFPKATIASEPVTPVVTPRVETPLVPETAKGNSRWPLMAGLGVLCLLAIAGAAWWFTADHTAPNQAAPSSLAQPATPPAVPSPAPASPARTPELPWIERSDGMGLRDLVQSAPDVASIHTAALRRQNAGRYDDALVLLEEAGERGHAAALTALARLYDPDGFVAGRPFRAPDPRAAARYYREAVQKGDEAAAAPRAALKTFLEEQARAGNGTAETALKDFWP